MQVLIVEDDPATRRVLRALFHREGWEADEAETVSEGLRLLDRAPDWVILDLMFPELHGGMILWEIRSRKLPVSVAVITGSALPERTEVVRALKPDLMMTKPIDASKLLSAMRGTFRE